MRQWDEAEFQSRIDRAMPVRMLQYVAALYDHLLRSKASKLKASGGGLPPVLPIVLCNGGRRWQHSPEVFGLIEPHPAALSAFQPRLKFWLLDQGQFSPEPLLGLQRVMAALFLVDRAADNLEAFKQAIRHFGQTVAQSPRKALIDQSLIGSNGCASAAAPICRRCPNWTKPTTCWRSATCSKPIFNA